MENTSDKNNGIINNIKYFIIGILYILFIGYICNFLYKKYCNLNKLGKTIVWVCLFILGVLTINNHEKQEAADEKWNNNLYGKYDSMPPAPEMEEIRERAERRKNGTMTEDDYK